MHNNIIIILLSQCFLSPPLSLSLRVSDDVFFIDTLSWAANYPAGSDHRPLPSFIQFRRWVSTMTKLPALARTYGRIYAYFWKICQRLRREIRGFRGENPWSLPPPGLYLYLSLADVRQRLLYNPRIIQFPFCRHARMHQLQITTVVLFTQKQLRDR